ncbi:MAG: hypothetical protein QG632_841 [Candidatus Dependentiae bacterium]|nr:hypothetical protein [Candidatus Dependentiae bacterium]
MRLLYLCNDGEKALELLESVPGIDVNVKTKEGRGAVDIVNDKLCCARVNQELKEKF